MTDLLLAIDTATAWCGVALYNGALQLELNWRAERRHSEQLMPSIEHALELTGIDRGELSAIGVSRGPGSYTGVRVGISIARMMAYALDIPIIGVDALDILAHPYADRGLPVRAFLDAGRRRYATALYEPKRGHLERVGSLQSVSDDSVAGLMTEPTICCGELSDAAREHLMRDADGQALLLSPASSVRRAAHLAEIAWQRWRSGEAAGGTTDPIYISSEQS